MSDENSFGAVATAPPPASVQAEEAPARSSKALLIAVGIAVAVLAVFGYLLFFRGGGEPEATGVVVVPQAPAAPGDTTDTGATTDTTTPPAKDVQGRNPFKPLVTEPAAADNTGTTDGTTTGTTTDPGTAPTGGTPPVTTPPPATNPSGATVTVKLVSIKGDTAATKVGNVNYTGLNPGDTFGTNFQLYAIFNPQCAGFLYGDDTFALCVGKSITLDKK